MSSWLAVKAVMTLIGNWRAVPFVGEGVLPNYSEYASGMWSWDTYKQAVGMALWAPELAKNQLRLVVSGRDYQAGLAHLAVGETVILLHPPLPLVGVSTNKITVSPTARPTSRTKSTAAATAAAVLASRHCCRGQCGECTTTRPTGPSCRRCIQ